MKISQRDASLEDIEWLEPFYESIMRPYYLDLGLTWDCSKFRECFDPISTKIIQADGIDIGMIKVRERTDYLYLGDLQNVKRKTLVKRGNPSIPFRRIKRSLILGQGIDLNAQ
jgi:hypothetical protein